MKGKIHIVSVSDPIPHHGLDQQALCGQIIPEAIPVTIVPDVTLASVGIIASTFGRNMCTPCQLREGDQTEGYAYFLISREDAARLKHQPEYAESV